MSEPINDGGPAFPVPGLQDHEEFNGMTLRDYFAAQALLGMKMENVNLASDEQLALACAVMAKVTYQMADAMLKARQS